MWLKQVKNKKSKFVHCNRKNSRIVTDNTVAAEGQGKNYESSGKISGKTSKTLATMIIKNLG